MKMMLQFVIFSHTHMACITRCVHVTGNISRILKYEYDNKWRATMMSIAKKRACDTVIFVKYPWKN